MGDVVGEKRRVEIIYSTQCENLKEKNEKILKDNVADFLIDQNSYIQGYRPPYILANILGKGQMPQSEFLFTDINIKTKYNL